MSRDYYCYLTAYLFYGSPRSSMYFLDPRSDARATAVAVSHSHLSVWRVGPFASKGDLQRFVHRARETRNGVQQRLSPAQEVELELYVAQARAQVDALPIADARQRARYFGLVQRRLRALVVCKSDLSDVMVSVSSAVAR
jgi:hypothetical protein